MLDITNIPPPRVPVIDDRTGLMSREWYRFLLSLFRLTGNGSNDVTLEDLQLSPQSQSEQSNTLQGEIDSLKVCPIPDVGPIVNELPLLSIVANNEQSIADLQNKIDTAPAIPQFGTVANYNFDNQAPLNGVLYSSTSIKTSSNLTFDGINFGVGTSSPTSLISGYSATNSTLRMEGDSTTQILVHRATTSAAGPAWFLRKSRGTIASPTAVSTSDLLGSIQWSAYGGSNYRTVADIRGYVETYASDTSIATYLGFYTSPAGSATGTERVRITSAGNIYNVAGGSTGMTDGFFYIPAAAGAPTGVPTAIANTVPMYYDTTNNKFYVYNGAWKSVILI
ncbi:MAG: hypothetical protein ACO3E4_06080 [Candidatus Nanopelagicaceae bacterium]